MLHPVKKVWRKSLFSLSLGSLLFNAAPAAANWDVELLDSDGETVCTASRGYPDGTFILFTQSRRTQSDNAIAFHFFNPIWPFESGQSATLGYMATDTGRFAESTVGKLSDGLAGFVSAEQIYDFAKEAEDQSLYLVTSEHTFGPYNADWLSTATSALIECGATRFGRPAPLAIDPFKE
jgi:hypothetical protein